MSIGRILATKGSGVVTVRPDQTVREAIAELSRHNIGALIVVEADNRPVGVVSERDIVREAARNEGLFALPVSQIMTTDVTTGQPNDDLKSVASTMTEKRIRHLPVVDQGKLVGIISIGDIVKAERNEFQGAIETLETQISAGY
ncbi:MAG: CBS domain-containing protein [Candidatus Rokubacteria bacterium]|nr:CBS domain-containing protein [Candidatus Rokubacteria bacterium]MBI3824781.1 CBS domain-containing protein [Candidatus Rokubacteria bacterium]